MLKLVTFTDAGDKPIYVNPALVTFIEHPAIGMFGSTAIHFVGDHQITVKEQTEAVLAALTGASDSPLAGDSALAGDGAPAGKPRSWPAPDQAIAMPAPSEV